MIQINDSEVSELLGKYGADLAMLTEQLNLLVWRKFHEFTTDNKVQVVDQDGKKVLIALDP